MARSEARTRAFQILKPRCVALSESALKLQSSSTSASEVSQRLRSLLEALNGSPPGSIDAKLAEYTFWPLSLIFRQAKILSALVQELALACLEVLLRTGWRTITDAKLASQLLLLLTFLLSDDTPELNRRIVFEQRDQTAYACIAAIFGGTHCAVKLQLIDAVHLPALGHTITVLLDGLNHSSSLDLQSIALNALSNFTSNVATREILVSFLPGVLSTLSHVLTPTTRIRRSYKILCPALDLVANSLETCLGESLDTHVVRQRGSIPADTKKDESSMDEDVATRDWQTATAVKVRIILANLIPLRKHDRREVRYSLRNLCLTVLNNCRESLADSLPMVLETLVSLSMDREDEASDASVRALISTEVQLALLLRTSLYSWAELLPRLIGSNDNVARHETTHMVIYAFDLLRETTLDLSLLYDLLLTGLQDALAAIFKSSAQTETPPVVASIEGHTTGSLVEYSNAINFEPVLAQSTLTIAAVKDIERLLQVASAMSSSSDFHIRTLDAISQGDPKTRLVNLWILTKMLEAPSHSEDIDAFLHLSTCESPEEAILEEAYSICLVLLTESESYAVNDWRIQAFALEMLALHAKRLQKGFRHELVDALYPVLQLLGSSNAHLCTHAVTCLNVLSKACEYSSVQEMLMSNVDYLINAVSIRLDNYNISPQSSQVLIMMIRLCGPALMPYLDDTLDRIFEALELFHGYTAIVELLFRVLRSAVEEGTKSHFIPNGRDRARKDHLIANTPLRWEEVIAKVKSTQNKRQARQQMSVTSVQSQRKHTSMPQEILGRAQSSKAIAKHQEDNGEDAYGQEQQTSSLSRTYSMLNRIAVLTQHHLPNSSPVVRTNLLSILSTALPYIANDEDTFLPLIHTLWPALLPRLSDRESYVVAGTLDILGIMCVWAGDFMLRRIDQVWPAIRLIHKDLEQNQREYETMKKTDHANRKPASIYAPGPEGGQVQLTRHDIEDLVVNQRPTLIENRFHDGSQPQPQQQHLVTLPKHKATRELANTAYTPTTNKTVREALTRFLLRLVGHVHIGFQIVDEITDDMLWDALAIEKRSDVKATLDRINPEAVAFALRHVQTDNVELKSLGSRGRELVARQSKGLEDALKHIRKSKAIVK